DVCSSDLASPAPRWPEAGRRRDRTRWPAGRCAAAGARGVGTPGATHVRSDPGRRRQARAENPGRQYGVRRQARPDRAHPPRPEVAGHPRSAFPALSGAPEPAEWRWRGRPPRHRRHGYSRRRDAGHHRRPRRYLAPPSSTGGAMTVLRFDNVSKLYSGGRQALREVSFEVGEGEMLFVTGHSGAGKTTLLKLIHLAERPSRGAVLFGEKNLLRVRGRKVAMHRRQVGVVLQDHRLLADRNVADNVGLPLLLQG